VSCNISRWPVAGDGFKLGGNIWLRTVDSLVNFTTAFPMAVLLGRAGMGSARLRAAGTSTQPNQEENPSLKFAEPTI
jgi:hypothetical protein